MARLTITIAGTCGSGKTSIAQHIFREMSRLGYDVSVEDIDLSLGTPLTGLGRRLKGLKNANLEVKIRTKQVRRRLKNEQA